MYNAILILCTESYTAELAVSPTDTFIFLPLLRVSRRKKAARMPHERSKTARKLRGIKAKLFNRRRFVEKAQMKKTIKQHEEKEGKQKEPETVPEGAVPSYLLDREGVSRTKILTNMIKQKRKEKAGKWQVPIPKVKAMTEEEMFKVLRSGKRKSKEKPRIFV